MMSALFTFLVAYALPLTTLKPVIPAVMPLRYPLRNLVGELPASIMPTTFSNLPRPWRCIARFESSDRVVVTNPASGDQGAFQIDPRTWLEYAPATFPTTPNAATLLEQFTVAQRIQFADGFHPWQTAPLCSGTGITGI